MISKITKLYEKYPTLMVWTFFALGVIFFMKGTIQPTIDPAVNIPVLVGEILFGIGIIIGIILVLKRKR